MIHQHQQRRVIRRLITVRRNAYVWKPTDELPRYHSMVKTNVRATEKKAILGFFENIYIGWGQKFIGSNFSPQFTPPVFVEFPSGPEVTEVEDPTPEEEAAWKAAQAEAAERAAGQHQDELEEEEDDEGDSEAIDDD
ncbi:hypothetical protein P879_07114 [Paragonimus westermani]|uniref:Uncharacterized protein n=1 Tax=Paragonimus westermani TaxID=34504 RepID=A0A8T0DA44_9TREM|nr:hypothetical protein P879_07114 [Paragonimus westermani]